MKYLFILGVFLFFGSRAWGQGTFNNTGSGLGDISRYMNDDDTVSDGESAEEPEEDAVVNKADPLGRITIEITDSAASFGNVPDLKTLRAHITNSDGEELEAQRITKVQNSMDVHDLPRGLFFITLTYKNYRKAFTLDRSEKN